MPSKKPTSAIPVDFDTISDAGRVALAAGDMRDAAKLLGFAAALARGSDQRAPLVRDLARSLEVTGELHRAGELLAEVASKAEGAPSSRRVAFLEVTALRDYTEATPDSFAALKDAAKVSAKELDVRARAAILDAEVSWTVAKYSTMAASLTKARDLARQLPNGPERRSLLNSILAWEARAALLGDENAEDGVKRCRGLLREARVSHTAEAAVLAARAGLQAMLGKFDDARKDYSRSQQIGEAFGLGAWLAALPLYSGPAELLAGRAADAERQLRTGYDALRRMGDKSRSATTAAFLAHALYIQHEDAEAETFARKSEELVADDDAFTQVVWRGALAKVLARRGDCKAAVELAQDAVKRSTKTDGLNLKGDALLDQAEVLHACGRSARRIAEAARKSYEDKGNVASERRANAFIARVGR